MIEPASASDGSKEPFEPADQRRPRPWTRLLIFMVRCYQRLFASRPSPCRFTPSCSTYAAEALEAHGAIRGIMLAVWRLLRCNPWGGQGYDPVPPSRHKRSHSCHQEVH